MAGPTPVVKGYSDLVEIGRGGFARVYRAHQDRFNRAVALKVLNLADPDERTRDRFERECRAMGELSWHPHVVAVYDSGVTDDGHLWLAMEYLERGSLADAVAETSVLDWPGAVAAGIEVCGALGAAHVAGTLHRDLKPENVLIGPFGEAKLADFGIAAVDGGRRTTTGVASFTVAHVAPEVLRGQRQDQRTDVYGLASTMHTLLAGRPPFAGDPDEPVAAVMMRIIDTPPPRLAEPVPDDLADLLVTGLAKEPADRPQSAAALGEALQEVQRRHGQAVTPLRLTTAPTSAPPVPVIADPAEPTVPDAAPAAEAGSGHETIVAAATAVTAGTDAMTDAASDAAGASATPDAPADAQSGFTTEAPVDAEAPADLLPPVAEAPADAEAPAAPDAPADAGSPVATDPAASDPNATITTGTPPVEAVSPTTPTPPPSAPGPPPAPPAPSAPSAPEPAGTPATVTPPAPPVAADGGPSSGGGRRGLLIAAGVVVVALLVGAAVLVLGGDDDGASEEGTFTTAQFATAPDAVAVNSDAVWVTDSSETLIYKLDPATGEEITNTGMNNAGTGIALTTDDAGWVIGDDTREMIRIDLPTNGDTNQVDVGEDMTSVSAVGTDVWVAHGADGEAGKLLRFDAIALAPATELEVGTAPNQVSATDDIIWVASTADDTITRVDPDTNEITATIDLDVEPSALAAVEDAVWVLSTDSNSLTRIDPDTNEVVDVIDVDQGGSAPVAVAATADAVWVVDNETDRVVRVDPATNEVTDAIKVSHEPVAVAATDTDVWVANSGDGTLTHIDPAAFG